MEPRGTMFLHMPVNPRGPPAYLGVGHLLLSVSLWFGQLDCPQLGHAGVPYSLGWQKGQDSLIPPVWLFMTALLPASSSTWGKEQQREKDKVHKGNTMWSLFQAGQPLRKMWCRGKGLRAQSMVEGGNRKDWEPERNVTSQQSP